MSADNPSNLTPPGRDSEAISALLQGSANINVFNTCAPFLYLLLDTPRTSSSMIELSVRDLTDHTQYSFRFDKSKNGDLTLCEIVTGGQVKLNLFDAHSVIYQEKTVAQAHKLSLLLTNICHIRTKVEDKACIILSPTNIALFGKDIPLYERAPIFHNMASHHDVQYIMSPITSHDTNTVLARDSTMIEKTTEIRGESTSYKITTKSDTIYNISYVKNQFWSAFEQTASDTLVLDKQLIEWLKSIVQDYNIVQNFGVLLNIFLPPVERDEAQETCFFDASEALLESEEPPFLGEDGGDWVNMP